MEFNRRKHISTCPEYVKDAYALIKAQAEDYTELDEKYRMLFEENERLKATRYMMHSDGRLEKIPQVDSGREAYEQGVNDLADRLKNYYLHLTGDLFTYLIAYHIEEVKKELLKENNNE